MRENIFNKKPKYNKYLGLRQGSRRETARVWPFLAHFSLYLSFDFILYFTEVISGGSVGSAVNGGNGGPGSGPSFEEEPSDSYIVRSKSTVLRCKTLNALKAWFACNTGQCLQCVRSPSVRRWVPFIDCNWLAIKSKTNWALVKQTMIWIIDCWIPWIGDEQSVQSKQNGHNYVDPQTGIRIVSNLFSLIIHRNHLWLSAALAWLHCRCHWAPFSAVQCRSGLTSHHKK